MYAVIPSIEFDCILTILEQAIRIKLIYRVQEELARRTSMNKSAVTRKKNQNLVRRLIASIKVVSAEKLIIQFQSGIVMEQEIRYE